MAQGEYSHILGTQVCATVKGMVFKPILLWDRVLSIVIIENWSRIGSHLKGLLRGQKL